MNPNKPPSEKEKLRDQLEKAIRKAEHLIDLGGNHVVDAFKILAESIQKRNPKSSAQVLWDPQYETAMMKLVHLLIELRGDRDNSFKTALNNFRIICHHTPNQQYAVLEKVVRNLIDKIEEQTKIAETKARDVKLNEIEDLEEELTDLVSSISGEDSHDRSDREIITPWLKFLWDSYRNVLDVLKNNSQVQKLYQEIAYKSFAFCVKHKRSREFIRLGDMIHLHLASLENMNSPFLNESLELHLQIRFEQLKTCITLELWQDAPKVLEDLNNLLSKQPEPPVEYFGTYFSNLAFLCWTSKNYLFHAYALHKVWDYYQDVVQNKIEVDEAKYKFPQPQELANTMLLSTLVISPTVAGQLPEDDPLWEKNLKLNAFFNFEESLSPPSRSDLLSEIYDSTVEDLISPELKGFLTLVEKKCNPLQFGATAQKILRWIESQPTLKDYAQPLTRTLVIRLVQQIQRVYKNITFDQLEKLIPFLPFSEIELFIIELSRNGYIHARFDFQSRLLKFETSKPGNVQTFLVQLASGLEQVIDLLPSTQTQTQEDIFKEILQNLEKEHLKLSSRQKTIDELNKKRKEELKKKEEALMKKKLEDQAKLDEERKRFKEQLEQEKKDREEKRKEEIQRFKAATVWKEYVEKEGNTEELKLIEKKIEKGLFDPDKWVEERKLRQEQEKLARERKYKNLEEKANALETAMRQEELPLLNVESEKEMEADKEYYEKATQEVLRTAEESHKKDVEMKHRYARMLSDKKSFDELIINKQKEKFAKQMEERAQRLKLLREEKEKEDEERIQREEREREERERLRLEKEEKERKLLEEQKGKYVPPHQRMDRSGSDNRPWRAESPRRYDDQDRGSSRNPREDDRGPRRYDDDRGPRRYDERSRRDDDRGPRRYDERDRRDDDRGPRRYDDQPRRYDDQPRRYDERDRRYDERGPRRDDDRSSRDPPRNDRGSSRDPKPDDNKYRPPTDVSRWKTASDDRGPRRDDRRDDRRDPPRRDDRRDPPRRDDRRDDRRDPPRRDDRRDDRRDPPRRDDRRDDRRDPPRRDDKKEQKNPEPDEEGFVMVVDKKKKH